MPVYIIQVKLSGIVLRSRRVRGIKCINVRNLCVVISIQSLPGCFFQEGYHSYGGGHYKYGGGKGFDIGAIFSKKKSLLYNLKNKLGKIITKVKEPFIRIKGELLRKGGTFWGL